MAIPVRDITMRENENWRIQISVHNEDDEVIPLESGSNVIFRLSGPVDGEVVDFLTLDVGNGVTITDADQGLAEIMILIDDQTENEITHSGIYYYEIKAIAQNVEYPQVEGKFFVERSLFSGATDPLFMEFQVRFPEITENDATIALFLKDAKRIVDGNASWSVEDRSIATVYLAAHLMLVRKSAQSSYESGNVATGAVKSISVEDRTVTFDTSSSSQSAQTSRYGLGQTGYGQQYLSMLRRLPQFILRA